MSQEIEISFNIVGRRSQTLKVFDPEKYPAEKIVEMLETGDAYTSDKAPGLVKLFVPGKPDGAPIAEVVSSVDNIEESDYELEDAS
jgi:hypothetical protein